MLTVCVLYINWKCYLQLGCWMGSVTHQRVYYSTIIIHRTHFIFMVSLLSSHDSSAGKFWRARYQFWKTGLKTFVRSFGRSRDRSHRSMHVMSGGYRYVSWSRTRYITSI